MEHTNKKWTDDSAFSFPQFLTDASDIAIPPGIDPNTVTVLDPWDRVVDNDFRADRRKDDIHSWDTYVISPEDKWVKLVIFND